jgi:hypothetical protein
MSGRIVKFPVVCPECGTESLQYLPLAEIASDLVSGRQIQLSAGCHARHWIANPVEVEQLREYLMCTTL